VLYEEQYNLYLHLLRNQKLKKKIFITIPDGKLKETRYFFGNIYFEGDFVDRGGLLLVSAMQRGTLSPFQLH